MTWHDRHQIIPAVYVVLREGGEVLLIRRANTGYRDGEYAFPAGHLEGGETARQAAVREVKEEIGVEVHMEDLRFVHVVHRLAEEKDHERVDFYFEAERWQGEPRNMEPHKCDDVRWFAVAALPENAVPSVAAILKSINEGSHYSDADF